MTKDELELFYKLDEILKRHYNQEGPDDERVYFNPPANLQMRFPCIAFRLNDYTNYRADDSRYLKFKQYQISVMTPDPLSTIHDEIMDELTFIRFNSSYYDNNLYHTVLTTTSGGIY